MSILPPWTRVVLIQWHADPFSLVEPVCRLLKAGPSSTKLNLHAIGV